MKKIKIFMSLILVIGILATSCLSVSAFEPTDVKDNVTLLEKLSDFEFIYRYYGQEVPLEAPGYSEESHQRVIDIIEEIESEIDTYTTPEEFQAASDKLDAVEAGLCIDDYYVKELLDYLKRDIDSTGYYDEETMNHLVEVYNSAQTAYDSGNEEAIHKAYMDLRNEFNTLCLYNNVAGDVNNDGTFNIKDVTIMQEVIAKYTTLTTSQNFITGMCHFSSISDVTDWQMELVRYNNNKSKSVDFNYSETLKCITLTPDMRNFGEIENASPNKLYDNEFYVWWM